MVGLFIYDLNAKPLVNIIFMEPIYCKYKFPLNTHFKGRYVQNTLNIQSN